eukprot:TRINITY_DN1017_c2_g2_i1.p2 TRINITY_DN1017_c2_g2~~TRINITY_DN1017_c2_g2_i1.p2  ORF type:complete len:194 (+),score=38.01 TRINITY_DN1017_c2_g2_i1:77-583(+)
MSSQLSVIMAVCAVLAVLVAITPSCEAHKSNKTTCTFEFTPLQAKFQPPQGTSPVGDWQVDMENIYCVPSEQSNGGGCDGGYHEHNAYNLSAIYSTTQATLNFTRPVAVTGVYGPLVYYSTHMALLNSDGSVKIDCTGYNNAIVTQETTAVVVEPNFQLASCYFTANH